MGVPKFFRYTSERYPCLNELVKQYQIPEFDNMYLDMNGIIHNCSHPDDSNPHFRITEEKIFQDIFHYISILFQIIKPKKLFFMAIDGVAPRAKMNQQRGRRFRSAREAEKLEDDAKKKGEVLPAEKRFDSNCITPGTVFMARLHDQLRYFVKQKISSDPLWAQVKVILSGHETPGEGEHKIMDYIRWARSQADYDPNTRHCLYGLDADLIMLGMCTHEPHFALLREEVKFGKTTQRTTSPEETNFYLLHLSLLREYLEQEFITIKDKLPFPYDIEKIVDDWVLMGFLVGNDFIPNLPNMHISNDALPLLYKTYMTVLPTLDGYINEAGDLNLARFETFMQELAKIDKEKFQDTYADLKYFEAKTGYINEAGDLNLARFETFMQELAKIDKEKFQDTYADLKYFEAKTGRRPNANERKEYKPNNDETFNVDVDDIKSNKPDDDLQALINATQEMFMDDMEADEEYEETSDEEANIEMEFILHKKDYYMNKLDYTKVTEEVLADQAEGYVRAIQWNLFYYYKGCPSWCWYYPHHYAPYISDIKGFKDLKIEFELGEPFKPFEQLLAVLPSASKHLLPAPFHDLMTDEDSPIVHYYPVHFETDLNGKRNDWEAVVLIPFIDEANLLSAMAPCYQRLTEDELKRNRHGPMLMFTWVPDNLGEEHAPEYFPSIKECHTYEKQVWRQEIAVPKDLLKRGMLPNANRDLLFPGFPTMRHLKYKTSLKKSKVKVFDQPSRNDNMIVEIIKDNLEEEPLEKIAHEYLGKVIWVGWPHLSQAKVISVSNEKNQEVAGYTRRCQVTNSWLYSARCIELVKSYAKQFPELFDSLVYSFGNDVFFEGDLWPGKVGQKKHHEVSAWLKSQPHSSAPRRECGSEVLEPDELKALDDNLQVQLAELRDQVKKVTLQVKWNLLYKPELNEGNVIPDVKADYKLYDRVVCVRECGAGAGGVRRGARGTVAGVLRADSTNPVRLSDRLNAAPTYHVMFDEPFLGGMTDELFDEPRFYRMQPTHMLNISFGRKLRQASSAGYPNHPSIKDSYVFNKTPTLLRRDDGHHSAFASYSPPADKTSTPTDNRSNNKNANSTPVTTEAPSQESATHLLKSLLKISKSDADNTPKTTNTPESWRSKNDNVQSPQHSQQPKIQQQNWRKEPTQYNNAKVQQQQVFTNEWVNSNFKSQAPVPPYPNFGQFPGPGPSQIPYPQFQNPNFQMHNQNYGMPNQRPQFNHINQGNMYHQNRQTEQHFPKHLPPVTGNNASISLMPSRAQPQVNITFIYQMLIITVCFPY
ncbi:hypothetical protein O3G_MSEX012236 [Manduca sexta]|uniref:5'-3' exoribonuclease 1 n=1 Tax=Manduca sexta TaxID=7130 RepID=A0A921ZMX0_MANSE|nr:hypothetical protein O3G_MSEX012236 [Manduca sexta]KAG6460816.1 hypothetical protein O3G_MSEX012236 [Manduca sexta]